MIERKKPRKRKPSRHINKKNNSLKSYNFQKNNFPRSRGDISKVLEKYNNLAQDAQSNGDRIVAENFLQYAEHYQRLLNDQPKPEFNNIKKNFSNTENSNDTTNKLSRTERAINATNARLNKTDEKQSNDLEVNDQKKENFTSDGLEALKPFSGNIKS